MGRLSPRRAWLPLQETFVPRRAWLPLTMELSPQATEGENSQPAPSAHPASQQARPISPSVKPFGLATSLVRGRQDGGRKQKTPAEIGGSHGRGRRIRTLGTRFWRPLLYQLSYTPLCECFVIIARFSRFVKRFLKKSCRRGGHARRGAAAFCAVLRHIRQKRAGNLA